MELGQFRIKKPGIMNTKLTEPTREVRIYFRPMLPSIC